jgi:pimeloyl-ACP methyl ester carboxylesterase
LNVYLFSGLGADGRVFKKLQLPANYNPIVIDYIQPLTKEPLQAYAKRIIAQIDTRKPFSIVGVSFGGILASEILEFINPQKTILVSSIGCNKELPLLYRFAGKLRLNRIIPSKKVKKTNALTYYIFGVKNTADKNLLKEILTSTNTAFSKWAVNAILNWQRKIPQQNLIRIHGTKDRLLPIKNFVPNYTIPKGGHLVILQESALLSQLISEIL